jgi:hypothetical protein
LWLGLSSGVPGRLLAAGRGPAAGVLRAGVGGPPAGTPRHRTARAGGGRRPLHNTYPSSHGRDKPGFGPLDRGGAICLGATSSSFSLSTSSSHVGQVVILNSEYAGNWVDCTIIAGPREMEGMESLYQDSVGAFDVIVHRTREYDRAVGYSGRPAFDISRAYLRHVCPASTGTHGPRQARPCCCVA